MSQLNRIHVAAGKGGASGLDDMLTRRPESKEACIATKQRMQL